MLWHRDTHSSADKLLWNSNEGCWVVALMKCRPFNCRTKIIGVKNLNFLNSNLAEFEYMTLHGKSAGIRIVVRWNCENCSLRIRRALILVQERYKSPLLVFFRPISTCDDGRSLFRITSPCRAESPDPLLLYYRTGCSRLAIAVVTYNMRVVFHKASHVMSYGLSCKITQSCAHDVIRKKLYFLGTNANMKECKFTSPTEWVIEYCGFKPSTHSFKIYPANVWDSYSNMKYDTKIYYMYKTY